MAASVLAPPLAAWESQLLPFSAGQYQEATVNFSGRDWRLLDFGYAGFELAAQPLGSGIPCNVFTVTGSGDISAELQTRVNSAVAAGGGRVIIPAGTFTVLGSIAVDGSNVSIEGAGSAQTILNVPSTYNPADKRYEGIFTLGKPLGGWNQAWVDRGAVLADVTADIAEGSPTVQVSTTANMAVGDWIVVRQYHWPAFSTAHSNGAWASYTGWPVPTTGGNRFFSFTYLRRIAAINANTLTLDAPIPWRLRLADNPIKIQSAVDDNCAGGCATAWIAPKQRLGVSGLSIRFADNFNDATFSPARPTGNAVYFEGVRDGWVYDVQIRNFPRYGVYLHSSARISILDSAAQGTQDDGGDGYGYSWHIQASQNVLLRRLYSEKVRHAYISQGALTSMLVYSRVDSAQARQGDDTHHSMVHANLWDRYRSLHGSGFRGENRGTTSGDAWETLGSGVVWNSWGDGHRGGYDGGALHFNPLSAGYGLVIGQSGPMPVYDGQHPNGDLMAPSAGLQVGPVLQAPAPGSKDRNVLYEGLGQGGLLPESLFETQLARRVGGLPVDFSSCSALPAKAPFAPSTYPGPDTLILDVDHLDWTASFGSGCGDYHGGTWSALCHAASTLRNHTPGGLRSARITPTGVNWAIMASWRGPTLTKADYTALELWVYPEAAGAEFRIQLHQSGYPETTDSNTAAYIVNGLTANTWNQVSIPMGSLGTGTFNKFEIRSTAAGGGVTFFIDDVVLKGAVGPSPTPTRTSTRTATRTPTSTSTRTLSPTATRSATPTLSTSPTPSPTGTRSTSPTPSLTATHSTSPTLSPTNTLGAGSPTVSSTVTPSPTATPSLTATQTPSASPTGSTSPTLSLTGTRSTSPTPSLTATLGVNSPTVSPTPSTSPTPSLTGTLTVNSPTVTSSPTSTRSTSPTWSPTGTRSMSPTLSPTSTLGASSPTVSSTVTPSPTATPSLTATQTPSASPTLSPTGTRSMSPTLSPTSTLGVSSPTVSSTVTSSPTAMPSLTATQTPPPSAGPLSILDAVPLPHPNARELRILLSAPAERLRLRYYSPAMVLLQEMVHGPLPQGWSRVPVVSGLPAGVVFVVLNAQQGSLQSLPRSPLRLYLVP